MDEVSNNHFCSVLRIDALFKKRCAANKAPRKYIPFRRNSLCRIFGDVTISLKDPIWRKKP